MNVYIYSDSPLPYEYSYDFRGKTLSQIISDWWTTAQWSPTITSNGYASTTSGRARSNLTLPSLATAKKITLNANVVFTNSYTYSKTVRLFTSSRTNATWWLITPWMDTQIQIWWDVIWIWAISSTWTFNTTAVFDLQNATYKFSSTWYSDRTGTLTSTQISNIRACTVAEAFAEDTNWAVSSMSLIVE